MMAILHGKARPHERGTPPKSVAAKYSAPDKDAPQQHGQNRGGSWDERHYKRAKERSKEERLKRKKHKKDKKELKKSFEDYYRGEAAATIIIDNNNNILLGNHIKGGLAFPGGHMDHGDLLDHAVTALRELKEETGLIGQNPYKIWEGHEEGNRVKVYLVENFRGKPKDTEELRNLKWYSPEEIEWSRLRSCCVAPLKWFVINKMGKYISGMLAAENMQKSLNATPTKTHIDVNPAEIARIAGNGLYRFMKEQLQDIEDESLREIDFDNYVIQVRKHIDGTYSGRVNDGHKTVFQYTNKTLNELVVSLMGLFEIFMPEDEGVFNHLDEIALPDDVIYGGLHTLIDNYRKHNLGNIYSEMENIRQQIRNGVAVDLQQVENKILKLFDKLEEVVNTVAKKHNQLSEDAGKEIDDLESKLRQLQSKIEELEKKPEVVEAFSSNPANKDKVYSSYYSYLSKPKVEILPNGKITIVFDSDWQMMEKENFLLDLRAKAVKKAGRGNG